MRISGPTRSTPVSTAKARKTAQTSGKRFTVAQSGESTGSTSVAPAAPVSRLDSLLTLQEVEEPNDQQRRAVQWGNEVLDKLEEIRLGLLLGELSRENLLSLREKIKQSRDNLQDPGLNMLLNDIELRAEVELAKLEQSA